MSYIGDKKRVTKRPVPQPVVRPAEDPGIAVPNWPKPERVGFPVPVTVPATTPQKVG